MRAYVYIFACFGMCLRVCISACVWMRVGAYKFIYFLACDSAYLHMRMCARVRVCACARVRVCACARVRVCACARVRARARVRVCVWPERSRYGGQLTVLQPIM